MCATGYAAGFREEEVKNKVAADGFGAYDCTRFFGAGDFCVSVKADGPTLWKTESLLWAGAKAGARTDLAPLFAQLVLPIGKWLSVYADKHGLPIVFISNGRNAFQNQKWVSILNRKEQRPTPRGWHITPGNVLPMCVFLAVRGKWGGAASCRAVAGGPPAPPEGPRFVAVGRKTCAWGVPGDFLGLGPDGDGPSRKLGGGKRGKMPPPRKRGRGGFRHACSQVGRLRPQVKV